MKWPLYKISPDQTHHLLNHQPAYKNRFLSVLKFHLPGYAPVQDLSGAYHIDENGLPLYSERYLRTFGFYQDRASIQSEEGWFHILPNGKELYSNRYAWSGNFQEGRCVVRDFEGLSFHIDLHGNRPYALKYSYAGDFHDGSAVIQNPLGLHSHIDLNGNLLHEKWFIDLDVFHKGFSRAKDHCGWFHLYPDGSEVYPQRYKNIEPFYNGISRVETADGELCLINESGEKMQILRPALDDPFHQASGERGDLLSGVQKQ